MEADAWPDKERFQVVWSVIQEAGVQERHFNGLQTTYRSLASAWLLASFSAMGFVLSNHLRVDIAPLLLIAGIGGAGALGISLLWVIDLRVYQQLLDACFIEALKLESRYEWLAPMRGNMMKTQGGRGVTSRVVGFYLVPIVFLEAISGTTAVLGISRGHSPWMRMGVIFAYIVAALATVIVIASKTDDTQSLRQRILNKMS